MRWQVSLEEGEAWRNMMGARFRALSTRTGEKIESLAWDIARDVLREIREPRPDEVQGPPAVEQQQKRNMGTLARVRKQVLGGK